MPKGQRDVEFKTYSLERQLEIYHCGMAWQPQQLDYAFFIAEGGEKNIPFLLEKLKTEDSEVDKTEIFYIFRAMAVKGLLEGRQDIIEQLEQIITVMKIQPFKEQAERDLVVIKNNAH